MAKPFDPKSIIFSPHAVDRFAERFIGKPSYDKNKALAKARRFLAGAKLEEMSPTGRVRRIISNGFENAEYYRHGKWRFVVVEKEGTYIVKTFEENSF